LSLIISGCIWRSKWDISKDSTASEVRSSAFKRTPVHLLLNSSINRFHFDTQETGWAPKAASLGQATLRLPPAQRLARFYSNCELFPFDRFRSACVTADARLPPTLPRMRDRPSLVEVCEPPRCPHYAFGSLLQLRNSMSAGSGFESNKIRLPHTPTHIFALKSSPSRSPALQRTISGIERSLARAPPSICLPNPEAEVTDLGELTCLDLFSVLKPPSIS
jgi:hypothetical protein